MPTSSTGNKTTELRLIQVFRANGITGWRRGCLLSLKVSGFRPQVSGTLSPKPKNPEPRTNNLRRSGRVRPDFVFPRLRVAVFVDGCFWHGCPKHGTQPKTNAAFWRDKIVTNKARDRRVNRLLRKRGWIVVRVWEHELSRKNESRLLRRLASVFGTKPGTVGPCVCPRFSPVIRGETVAKGRSWSARGLRQGLARSVREG